MGLFDFFKKAGSKALVEEEKKQDVKKESSLAKEIAKKAKIAVFHNIVKSLNLEVSDLEIDLEGDLITVGGKVTSHETREKIILALGNVEGIAQVQDYIIVDEPEVPESTFYTVQKGDSLSKIAKKVYGDAMKYPVIFEANKPMLDSPDRIYPGQNLRIPTLTA